MRITSTMLVADSYVDDAVDLRGCPKCGLAFYTPQKVMVFSSGGARSMRLWTCESHRLPDTITDDPTKEWGA